MDKDNTGFVSKDVLAKTVNCSKDPNVLNGKMTANELCDMFVNMVCTDGKLSLDAFVKMVADWSVQCPSDDVFA